MINLSEYLIDVEYNTLVNEEYFNLTSNEIINESSGYSGLCTKQTKKSNSLNKK